MDFNQLSIFMAVAEELHFGRAAERLHMAQPPVSRAVAQLEKSLGAKLFERSTRRVELTAAGVSLLASTRKILEAIEEARSHVKSAVDGASGHIDIVFAGASTHRLVGKLSRGLRQSYPGISTTFHSQGFAQDALNRLLKREVDIGLGRWDFLPPDVESCLVRKESLVLAVPRGHPLAEAPAITFKALATEQFVELTDTKSVLHDRLIRLAHAANFEPNIVQRAPDTWTALALVAAEIGVLLTLDSVQENVQDEHLRFVPVTDVTTPIQLRMAWLSDNKNPALPRVVNEAKSIWVNPTEVEPRAADGGNTSPVPVNYPETFTP